MGSLAIAFLLFAIYAAPVMNDSRQNEGLAEGQGFEPWIPQSATDENPEGRFKGLEPAVPTPSESGGPETRALRPRECDCPPWVIRCAHFEGRVITLHGAVFFFDKEQFVCEHASDDWAINGTPNLHRWDVNECGRIRHFAGGNEAAALAAFDAACERLLEASR